MISSKVNWPIVALLCATATAGYMCRVNVSTAGALIMDEFNLSQVEMGRIFSAFLLGYALFQIPAGLVADYLGPRRLLLIATWLWVVLTILPIVASLSSMQVMTFSITSFMVSRFLLGIAASPAYPGSAKCVSRWIPTGFQGRANGIILASVGLGSALTPPLVSYIMVEWGWRIAIVVSALPALGLALIWLNVKEQPVANEVIRSEPEIPTRSFVTSKSFILLTVSYTLQGYVGYIFISWFYLYLVQERHFSLLSGAWVSSLPWVLSIIAIPMGGVLSDFLRIKTGRSYLFPLVAMCLSGVFIAFGAHTGTAWIAAGTLAIATALILCVEGPFWTMMIQIEPHKSGRAGGIMNAGSNAGGLISPMLTPIIASYIGWENALHIAAAIAVVGGLLWFGIHPGEEGR